jgi:hypothetical protein
MEAYQKRTLRILIVEIDAIFLLGMADHMNQTILAFSFKHRKSAYGR